MSTTKIVDVAAAVLMRNDGTVLLASRPEGKGWAGWWEFPGGKIEVGESPTEALRRELDEELGIQVETAYPWLVRTFAYPEKTVKLHFFIVRAWAGNPEGREGQQLSWQNPFNLTVSPMLPANAPILNALKLPDIYAITNAHEMGEDVFLEALTNRLASGLKLIQVREKNLAADALMAFSKKVTGIAHQHGACVLMNGDVELVEAVGADGVHLSSLALASIKTKPEGMLVAASCHHAQDLALAAQLQLDFVLLSPVLPTLSHPDAATLGWEAFANLKSDYPLPVYALGGMNPQLLEQAWTSGAHGIAMQRAVWE
jgi:8-oxo-dGTP diphosphatase